MECETGSGSQYKSLLSSNWEATVNPVSKVTYVVCVSCKVNATRDSVLMHCYIVHFDCTRRNSTEWNNDYFSI